MATASVNYVFANGTNADGTQVNANFNSVLNFVNTELIQRDASIAFTAIPTLPATDPTLDNHVARKRYVDLLIPAGTIVQFAGSTVPDGWLLCDGTQYAYGNSTYTRLYSAIGFSYGGSLAAGVFGVPNLKGRVPVGRDATQTEFDVLGDFGGNKAESLSTLQIPSHTHGVGTYLVSTSAEHTHANTFSVGAGGDHQHSFSTTTVPDGSHTHTHTGITSENYVLLRNPSYQSDLWSVPNNTGTGLALTYIQSLGHTYSGTHTHSVSGTTGFSSTHLHSLSGGVSNGGAHTHTLTGSSLSQKTNG